MSREFGRPINIDDVDFFCRREFLRKSLRTITGAGFLVTFGSIGYGMYQGTQDNEARVELRETNTESSKSDSPEKKIHAQDQSDQKKAQCEEIVRKLPDSISGRTKVGKKVGYGGLITAGTSFIAENLVEKKTDRELYRRELFHRNNQEQ